MAHPYSRNHLHLVFSTKDHRAFIKACLRDELYRDLRLVAKDYGISIDLIGGTEDHVHILLQLPPKLAAANLVCALKAKSSKWMNERGHVFAWQNSYGCFSVSVSNLERVKEYIRLQEEHHKKRDFLEEFNALLRRHGIESNAESMFSRPSQTGGAGRPGPKGLPPLRA
jgi:REP element-mobilizing transposase RayT